MNIVKIREFFKFEVQSEYTKKGEFRSNFMQYKQTKILNIDEPCDYSECAPLCILKMQAYDFSVRLIIFNH